jgi:hypothetical protein
MAHMQQQVEQADFAAPSEVREFTNGRLELVEIGGATVGRNILQPGWRWANDVKPIAGTEWCEAPHMQYVIQGHLHVVMDDGREIEAGPGEVISLPARHDAWVVGDEEFIAIDWAGATHYAQDGNGGGGR